MSFQHCPHSASKRHIWKGHFYLFGIPIMRKCRMCNARRIF